MADRETTQALAKVLESSYDFDLKSAANREAFKSVVKLADKQLDQQPVIAESVQNHNRKSLWIGVVAIVVTITFLIWVNHLNHQKNVELEKQRIVQPAPSSTQQGEGK